MSAREDSRGGDNRPAVYFDPAVDRWIYRASALSRCDRELVAIRNGQEPEPVPDWLMRRFNEGHDFEDEIMARAGSELGMTIQSQQMSVLIPVGKRAAVRGSIDGLGYPLVDKPGKAPAPTDPCALIDGKFVGPDLHSKLLSGGFAGNPGYAWQQSVYFHGLRAAGFNVVKACLAVGLKEYDGDKNAIGIEQMDYVWAETIGDGETEPLEVRMSFTLAQIKARVMALEKLAAIARESADLPSCCDPRQFPCGTAFLCEEKETPVIVGRGAELLDTAARLYEEAKTHETVAKKRKAEAGELVREVLTTEPGMSPDEGTRISTAAGTDITWVVTAPTEDQTIPNYVKKGRKGSTYPKFNNTPLSAKAAANTNTKKDKK